MGPCPNGGEPDALIQGSDGNFYGAALYSAENPGNGRKIFSVTPAGAFTVLHAFVPGSNNKYANGNGPVTLTEGPDGNLYGTTEFGGNDLGEGGFRGDGVLFRIGRSGSSFSRHADADRIHAAFRGPLPATEHWPAKGRSYWPI